MEKRMYSPIRLQGARFDVLGRRSRVLLCAAALIGCSVSTAATTGGEDKAKAPISAPSKPSDADADSAASTPATPAAPTATVQHDVDQSIAGAVAGVVRGATPDSDTPPSKKHRRGHIQIGDDEFDSFNDALHTAPWVVGLAFLVAGSILLTPVFLLIGIIWYKLRKTRLQNEALLKLAEKGMMPPAQAVDTMMSGVTQDAAASAGASTTASVATPVYQQAIIARRRAVWSDLRRGVILIAVGLSFVFYSMIENGSANWVGLVLLFLGIGYILLWWFEDRHLQDRERGVDVGKG
jgi:hypothetical protein